KPSTGPTVLDAAMTQSGPGSEHTDDEDEARDSTSASDLDQERRTSMAAERTWRRGGAPRWVPPPARSQWDGSPQTARRRPVALHPARLRLRVARGRTLDRRRTAPARPGACASNRRSRTLELPDRRAVHCRRRRSRLADPRTRDCTELSRGEASV